VVQALRAAAEREKGNTQSDLLALADGLESGILSPVMRSLLADEGLANRVQSILADSDWGCESQRDRLSRLFGDVSDLGVDDTKRDTLDNGELAASAFTTIFIVAGLAVKAAGIGVLSLLVSVADHFLTLAGDAVVVAAVGTTMGLFLLMLVL
jgi:hypothetical protein